jgi:branched-subunit amino acid aminotransferase/4-amino-4-deoxychorismate lyase
MANTLHRSQTRLWRARNRSLFTAVIGTRWMSNLTWQSPLSDIEVPSIFIVHIVLMSVPELAWKAKDPQDTHADFEGLKAYRNKNGKVTLFRPDLNMARMNLSAERLALPVSLMRVWCDDALKISIQKAFNGAALLDLIKELVRLDRHWIPQEDGHSLYIRPVMSAFLDILHNVRMVLIGVSHDATTVLVGTQNTVGITPPDSALLFVICSPVGPYYPDGFKPVALYGTTEHVRAYPGGPFIR